MVGIENVNNFVKSMLASEEKFAQGLSEYNEKQSKVSTAFDNLKKESEKISKNAVVNGKDNQFAAIINSISAAFNNAIAANSDEIEKSGKGMSFIQEHEKTFVVSVFGKVKSGKSSLGNFIMGEEIKKLGIKSEYDNLNIDVKVQDRGNVEIARKLEVLKEGEKGFAVGSTETTSTIQFFKIGGLAWFDTPGIGSVTKENEVLAQEYIKNSDLVIFTCSSDAAGTQQEFAEMHKLVEMGKPILLLITQSDTYEEDEDDDGNIIKVMNPKNGKDRADVEDYMRRTLNEQGLEDVLKHGEMLTISKQLAVYALQNGDDEKYKQSNMDEFLKRLIDITENEAAEIKLETPNKRINSMIDSIIGSEKDDKSLVKLKEKVQKSVTDLEKTKKDLDKKREMILSDIKSQSYRKIDDLIEQYKNRIEQNHETINSREMADNIVNIIADVSKKVCEKELSQFMSENANKIFDNMKSSGFSIPDMKMQTESISYQQEYVERRKRDPKGLREKIGSWIFKNEYYETKRKTRTRTNTFDVGINESAIRDSINEQIRDYFKYNIDEYIKEIIVCYFEPQQKLLKEYIKLIENTINQLKLLK